MKKTILLFTLLLVTLLVGCGVPKLDEVALVDLLSYELESDVSKVEILTQSTDEKRSDVEVQVTIDNDGVEQTGIINAKCKYIESDKEWSIYDYDLDSSGWTYAPTASVVESNDSIFGNYFIDKQLSFENEDAYVEADNVMIENLLSLDMDLEHGNEIVEFDLVYNNENFTGKSKCKAELNFDEFGWYVTSINYDPISLEWKNQNMITTTRETLSKFIDEKTSKGIYLEEGKLSCYISDKDINEFIVKQEATPYKTDSAQAKVEISSDLLVGQANGTLLLEYKKDKNGRWLVYEVYFDQDEVDLSVANNLEGIWKGYYIDDGKKRAAELKITKYIETSNMYEGIFSYGSSNTYQSESASYYFTLNFDLENREIELDAGNWIEEGDSYNPEDFILYLKDANQLFGHIRSVWGNDNNDICEFTRLDESEEVAQE